MSQEHPHRSDPLFDSDVEQELSDLDGDGGSDDEGNHVAYVDQHSEQGNDGEDAAALRKPRLPSFKKQNREISEEENADLARIREELRSRKQTGSEQEDGEEEPKKPDHVQGIIEEEERQMLNMDSPNAFYEATLDELDRHIAKVTASGRRKRKKVDEEDLERSMDEEVIQLRERMKMAAEEDTMANNDRKPALAKIKMLNEVSSMMSNKRAQDFILDNQLLDMVRLWLEPLPDRSLPSLDIQNEMLETLDKLPISGDHLRESGVGKIVYFYQKSPRVDPRVKRRAEQLVAKWSRLVIKRSANYRERMHEHREYSREEMLSRRKKYRPEENQEEGDNGPRKMHVSIPQAVAPDYDIIPQSTVKATRTKSNKDQASSLKRLNNTIRSLKGGNRRPKKDA